MAKIVKDGRIFGGTPLEVITAWPPTGDMAEIERSSIGSTDISEISDGTITGAISNLNDSLFDLTYESLNSTSSTVAAGYTAWQSVVIPSAWKNVKMLGYYIQGEGNALMNIYACYNTEAVATIALKNTSTTDLTVYTTFYFSHA